MTAVFQTAGTLLAGQGSFQSIAGRLAAWDNKPRRVLVVTSPSLAAAGWAEALQNGLSREGIASDCLTIHLKEPTAEQIEDLNQRVEREPFDAYVGVGGGSILDAVKLLSVRRTNSQPVEAMLGVGKVIREGLPTVLVPTTAGTGAEVTPNAIVTLPDQELKVGVVSDRLYPRLAVLDPELTLSLPQEATAATGMDAFTHALESYLGKKANPISDMYALESIRLISGSLVRSYEDGQSLSARSDMLYGSAFGGMALAAAGTAAVHAMAYPLGGRFGIAHGTANAMLLPHVLEAQLDEVRGRLEAAAAAMRQGLSGAGEDGIPIQPGADWALEQMADWVKRLGIPQDLTAWGVKAADLPDLAEAASKVTRLMANNPKAFTVGELEQIYRRLMPAKNA